RARARCTRAGRAREGRGAPWRRSISARAPRSRRTARAGLLGAGSGEGPAGARVGGGGAEQVRGHETRLARGAPLVERRHRLAYGRIVGVGLERVVGEMAGGGEVARLG